MLVLGGAVLMLHAVCVAASVLAFWLVVGKPAPADVPPDVWARAYGFGMRWTGILYIVTGFLAALCGWLAAVPVGRAAIAVAAVLALSLGAELLGTFTGLPFGPYSYGTLLGTRILGLVPWVIPLSWFMMLYASLGIAVRMRRGRIGTVVAAALGLVAWDVLMDPAMSAVFPFWSWHVEGVYFGMPLVNWLGWFVTGLAIAAVAAAAAGPALRSLADQTLPRALYVVNGLFPLALLLAERLYVAAAVGGAAMLLYLASPRLLPTGVPDSRSAVPPRR